MTFYSLQAFLYGFNLQLIDHNYYCSGSEIPSILYNKTVSVQQSNYLNLQKTIYSVSAWYLLI